MSPTPIPHLYRSLLRELRLSSLKSRTTRSPIIAREVRTIVETTSPSSLERTLVETRDFLRSSRIHGELLKRYNPLHDMTEEERVRATARRVGLDTPLEFKEEN